MSDQVSRRSFLRQSLSVSALGIGAGLVLTACGKSGGGAAAAGCNDTSGLAEADKAMRTTNNYVEAAADASKACEKCQLYVAAAAGAACGGCSVIKGPINPKGSCNLFAPKA
ncbi:MAG: hypothetical protein RIT45_3050 [Pseudomonadota bacterium]|jgi:hypothetical protein